VIAADRQATHGAMGQQTVGQSVTKVEVVHGEALYATSGHKGLGQQLCAIINARQPEFKRQGYDRQLAKLQEAFRPFIDAGFQTAKHAAGVVGNAISGFVPERITGQSQFWAAGRSGAHRHDREGRIAGLTHKGEFTFVLLVLPSPPGPISTITALAAPMACSSARKVTSAT
jgi:hypothetical protein